MSSPIHCPVHLRFYCFSDGPPFDHNIRLNPGEEVARLPKRDHGFIYKISHFTTGMCYVGRTEKRLSDRWALHRSAGKSEKRKSDPLYRAMKEDGIHQFVMERLEECGVEILGSRELDYMRQLESWNPRKGYNGPSLAARYARNLYFAHNPVQELRYKILHEGPKVLVGRWLESAPPDREWIEEMRELDETSLREGRRLMEIIPSLTRPVILASLPPTD